MIVKPTVNELLDHAENRFALVIAASKRAREIANGGEVLTEVKEEAPVTLAANEINEGKIKIYSNKIDLKENIEKTESNNETITE